MYPNPYSGNTTIEFILNETSLLNLEVYNFLGEKIQILENREMSAGKYKYVFSAGNKGYSEGVYFLKFFTQSLSKGTSGNKMQTVKLIEIE